MALIKLGSSRDFRQALDRNFKAPDFRRPKVEKPWYDVAADIMAHPLTQFGVAAIDRATSRPIAEAGAAEQYAGAFGDPPPPAPAGHPGGAPLQPVPYQPPPGTTAAKMWGAPGPQFFGDPPPPVDPTLKGTAKPQFQPAQPVLPTGAPPQMAGAGPPMPPGGLPGVGGLTPTPPAGGGMQPTGEKTPDGATVFAAPAETGITWAGVAGALRQAGRETGVGPDISDDVLLEVIGALQDKGWTPQQAADRINELGISDMQPGQVQHLRSLGPERLEQLAEQAAAEGKGKEYLQPLIEAAEGNVGTGAPKGGKQDVFTDIATGRHNTAAKQRVLAAWERGRKRMPRRGLSDYQKALLKQRADWDAERIKTEQVKREMMRKGDPLEESKRQLNKAKAAAAGALTRKRKAETEAVRMKAIKDFIKDAGEKAAGGKGSDVEVRQLVQKMAELEAEALSMQANPPPDYDWSWLEASGYPPVYIAELREKFLTNNKAQAQKHAADVEARQREGRALWHRLRDLVPEKDVIWLDPSIPGWLK